MPKTVPVTLTDNSGKVLKMESIAKAAKHISIECKRHINEANIRSYMNSERRFLGYKIQTAEKQYA